MRCKIKGSCYQLSDILISEASYKWKHETSCIGLGTHLSNNLKSSLGTIVFQEGIHFSINFISSINFIQYMSLLLNSFYF